MTSTEDLPNDNSNNNNNSGSETTDQVEPEVQEFETQEEDTVEQFSSFDELIEKVKKAKEDGNELFRKKQFIETIPFYNQAIKIWFDVLEAKYDISSTKEQIQQLRTLIRDTYNNAALAILEMDGNLEDALRCASSAFKIQENTKSIYIQAKVFYLCKHIARAKIYLNLVLREQPTNKEAQQLLSECELFEKEYDYAPSFHYDPLKQKEDDELQKAIALSKLEYEEEEKRRAEEQTKTEQADKIQEEILRNFEIEQQKKKLEQLKEEESNHNEDEEDYEIEFDDDDHEGELHEEDEDAISLTESEIEEQMRLLELEEKKTNFIETDDVD